MFSIPAAVLVSFATKLLGGVVTAYNKSKDVTIAGYQAGASMVNAQAEYMTAVLGHPLSAPSLACYAVVLYYGKAIAYDNVISHWLFGKYGYTPPLEATTATAAMIILTGMFSSGIFKLLKQ